MSFFTRLYIYLERNTGTGTGTGREKIAEAHSDMPRSKKLSQRPRDNLSCSQKKFETDFRHLSSSKKTLTTKKP